ncbi:MAG: DUF1080 domain-containing protein [Cyclobacteriaceae bacterium]|jgi:hypothetical protein|nr:DUF1080 domain-containing protein [Cyclobacteriaceae bacterium]
MKITKVFFPIMCALLVLFSCTNKKTKPLIEENWIQLFNGKDLTGWDIKFTGHEINDNYKNTFVVEDGILKVNYGEYENFDKKYAHLYYQKPYSHYRLRIEYRFVGDQLPGGEVWENFNSGVMLHSQSAKEQQFNQDFPASIEMQFLGDVGGEKRTNGNLASPGTHVNAGDSLHTNHMLYSSFKAPSGSDWINIEAVVLGDSIVHHVVEGDTALTYTNPQIGGWEVPRNRERPWVENLSWFIENEGKLLKEGYIALQAESHGVQFRKVELLDLSEQVK